MPGAPIPPPFTNDPSEARMTAGAFGRAIARPAAAPCCGLG